MPRTTRVKPQPERLALVADEILDQFTLDRPMTADDIDTAGRRLKKALMEALDGRGLPVREI